MENLTSRETNNNLCSVVMPVFKTPFHYLTTSIDSLISQTYQEKEVIVVFDGLDMPEYKRFIKRYNRPDITIDQIQHVGIAGALNYGIQKCKGRYILRADGDDSSVSERMAVQIETLQKTGASVCGSAQRLCRNGITSEQTDDVIQVFPRSNIRIKLASCYTNSISHPTVCIDRWKLRQSLVYPEHAKHEDFELWSSLALTEKFVNVNATLVNYRIHPGQYTNTTRYGMLINTRLKFVRSLPMVYRPLGLLLAFCGVCNGIVSRLLH